MNRTGSNSDTNGQVGRRIGLFTATGIVVANMIGSGIFVTLGIMAGKLPSPAWVLFCWFFGGMIALAGALCYGELGTRMPEEGGEYIYLKKLFHPSLGFLSGWTSFIVGFSAPIAGSALGFSEYLFAGLNIDAALFDSFSILMMKKSVALFIIVLFTMLHYLGVRTGGGVQNVLTAMKVILILGLSLVGLFIGRGSWEYVSAPGSGLFGGFAFGTAMMLVMFAYSGWNASGYIAGEIKDPRRTLPLSLMIGTGIVMAVYLALNLFVIRSLPFTAVRENVSVVESAAVSAFGDWMGNALGVIIAFALLSSLSAFIMIGPRIYFAMARDGLFFRFASRVHPKYEVPGRSIVIQGAIALIMVLFSSIEQLVVYLIYALNIFPWLAVLGLFLARKRGIGDRTAVKAWGYPVLPIFFLISTLMLAVIAYINRPVESTAAIITVGIGIPCYFFWAKKIRKETGSGNKA